MREADHVTRRIEVLRAGTFAPMTGAPVSFSADDLKAIAAAFNREAAPVPAVVGHPSTDHPAYGWAKSFSYDEASQRLVAELDEVEPQFADAVAQGRYKRVSLSLFSPDASNNPTPGAWYPKHIGFLGAAAPAVSGLKPVSFAADTAGVVTFEFADMSAMRDVAGLFRSLRDFFIEKFGLESADATLPGWTIGWIADAANADDLPGLAFSEPKPNEFKLPEPLMTKTAETKTAAEIETERKASEQRSTEREAALNARERAANHADNVAFAETLIADRRLLPVLKDKVVGLLNSLAPLAGAQLEVSFAEGSETKTAAALDLVRDVLKAQPAVVSFGSVDLGKDTPSIDFAMADGMVADPTSAELHARAVAHQASHPGTDYMTAIAAVNRQ